MSALGHISSAALKQYLDHGQARGLDIHQALTRAQLTPADIASPQARIPGPAFQVLLEMLVTQSRDPLFGLHTSEFVQPGSYNVMGYIAMSSRTLQEALSKVSLYEKLVGDMGTTDVVHQHGLAQLRWHCRYPGHPARQHLIDNVLGSWIRYARWLTGHTALAPEQVWLEHDAPAQPAIRDEYQRVFQCPVHFQQPYSALIGPPALLQHPLKQPDPLLLSTLEAHAAQQLNELGVTTRLSERVRQCIEDSLGPELPRKAAVAKKLGMNVRTLHRHLLHEGQNWQALLDAVRLDKARYWLNNSALAQTAIAERLGYSDIRSFQRSFKRGTGQTPGQFRQQARVNAQ